MEFNTPIAFFIFNRPDLTSQVFAKIAQLRPRFLLLVADGPRSSKPEDSANCPAARAVVEQISWPCTVLRNYSDQNLGCKKRISSGLDWVFENVERAIILEDDCLPSDDFFRFCEEMLDRYQNDERVMMVSGCSFSQKALHQKDSYYFARWGHIWGWASWRRAWKYYDVSMSKWPEFRDKGLLKQLVPNAIQRMSWHRQFEKTWRGEIDTWDYQWTFAILARGALSLQSKCNLITNVGFGGEATHTLHQNEFSNRPLQKLSFPLLHPTFVLPDLKIEAEIQNRFKSLFRKLKVRLKSKLSRK